MKKNKKLIILLIVAVAVLTAAFFLNPTAGTQKDADISGSAPIVTDNVTASADASEQKKEAPEDTEQKTVSNQSDSSAIQTDAVQTEQPLSEEEQTASVPPSAPEQSAHSSDTADELTCTLSVRCDTVLSNMNMLDPQKVGIIPENGVIFNEKTVIFYEGESVFNLLRREMKKNKIHLEFTNTPVYNSAYIEGIGNLYEFDCGELSGWMYSVNGVFPNYGCSRCELNPGDKVEFVYTCDLGKDVRGEYSARNGR